MNAGPRTETVRSSEDERKSWGENTRENPPAPADETPAPRGKGEKLSTLMITGDMVSADPGRTKAPNTRASSTSGPSWATRRPSTG